MTEKEILQRLREDVVDASEPVDKYSIYNKGVRLGEKCTLDIVEEVLNHSRRRDTEFLLKKIKRAMEE